MQMVDNTLRKVPVARVHVDSSYLTVEVEALCPRDAVYDGIVGNVPGARAANDPDKSWHETAWCRHDQVAVESGWSDGSFVQVTGKAMAHGKHGRNREIAGGG